MGPSLAFSPPPLISLCTHRAKAGRKWDLWAVLCFFCFFSEPLVHNLSSFFHASSSLNNAAFCMLNPQSGVSFSDLCCPVYSPRALSTCVHYAWIRAWLSQLVWICCPKRALGSAHHILSGMHADPVARGGEALSGPGKPMGQSRCSAMCQKLGK